MQRPHQLGVDAEVRVRGRGEHIRQGTPVAGDLRPGSFVGTQRLFVVYGRDGVLLRDLVSLDAVGAADGAGLRRPPQCSRPASGHAKVRRELLAQRVDLVEGAAVLEVRLRGVVDRHESGVWRGSMSLTK